MSRIIRDEFVINYEGAYVEGCDDEYDDDELTANDDESPLAIPTLNYEAMASKNLVNSVKPQQVSNSNRYFRQAGNRNDDDSPLAIPTINFASDFQQRLRSHSNDARTEGLNDAYDDDAPLTPPSLF